MTTRVGDMSIDEFKAVIQETVAQTLTELLGDPDIGLELSGELQYALENSLKSLQERRATYANVVVRTGRGLTIAGTRITLYTILEHLHNQWPPHLIQDWFNLTDQQTQGALNYIDAHRAEVEAEYQQVVQEAAETERYWRDYNQEHLSQLAAQPWKPGQEQIRAKLEARRTKWAQIS